MNRFIHFAIVFRVISWNMFVTTAAMMVSAGVALIYSEEVMPFLMTSLLTFLTGIILYVAAGKKNEDIGLQRRDAYFTVTLSWLVLAFAGCLPYLFSGAIPNFTDAFFESVSGFTTTGSSILIDIEALPKSILFWRSLTHWIGGIGIIVLVIIVMPALHIGGYQLFTLESSLQEKIQPKIRSVGFRLLFIYVGLTLAEVILLLTGGMNLFESVCHSFGTIATGGFSPKNTSIIEYSPYIQYVITLFMFLAGTNFVVHYHIIKRQFNRVKENEELRFYILMVCVMGLMVSASLFFSMNKPLEESFREGFFQVMSIISCTGFASADYLQYPVFAWVVIFLCMFLGGSTGSTAGGIKMVRHLILFKNAGRMFRRLTNPNAILMIRLNKNPLSEKVNTSILTFITVYVSFFLLGSLSLIFMGIDGQTATSSVATTMAGIGPGFGTVGPVSNFAHLPDAAKYTLCFFMLIGRLEIYTFIMLFTPGFWKR
jgi:trk system potassium uptake protein